MKLGQECPQMWAENHWTHRMPERIHTKLTADEVRTIRAVDPRIPSAVLARTYRVSKVTIGHIRHRRTWKHL